MTRKTHVRSKQMALCVCLRLSVARCGIARSVQFEWLSKRSRDTSVSQVDRTAVCAAPHEVNVYAIKSFDICFSLRECVLLNYGNIIMLFVIVRLHLTKLLQFFCYWWIDPEVNSGHRRCAAEKWV